MTDEYVERRRRYIQEVRNSFSDRKDGTKKEQLFGGSLQTDAEADTVGSFAVWKVKILIAIMLFAAFVFCDRTDTPLFSMSTDAIVEQLKENDLLPMAKKTLEQIQGYLGKDKIF